MKDFPTNGSGANGGNGGSNGGGRKDDFMDQINNLKFSEDSNKNPNI